MSHEQWRKSDKGMKLIAQVRDVCKHLPDAVEKVDQFGHTAFRVNDKPFVMIGESIAIKTAPSTQEFLLQQDHFFKTPYIGQHGWVSVRDFELVDWQDLEKLIIEGYRRTAPKKLVKKLDENIDD